MAYIKLDHVKSTNDYVKSHMDELQHFDIVYTTNQTNGKGRRTNQWYSTKESLTFSICLKTTLSQEAFSLIPFYTGSILHQVLSTFSNDLLIKWPNDLLLKQKKVAGILTESIIQQDQISLIVGIGLNVNHTKFPLDLADKAISLRQVLHRSIPMNILLNDICQRFIDQFDHYCLYPQDVLKYCENHLAYKNQNITFHHQHHVVEGTLIGIHPKGYLTIQIGNKLHHFLSGEVKQIQQNQ